jgi:ferritin-like metal-binding protein YciE
MEYKTPYTMHNLAKTGVSNWPYILEDKSPLVELFLGVIKEAYWSENYLARTLLKMVNAAASGELKHSLNYLLDRTKAHATKLEHIFELLDETIDARRCEAIAGLSAEADEMVEYTDEGTAARDIGIIMVCQKIELYQIVTYDGLLKLAIMIGRQDIGAFFGEILYDEKECSELLDDQMENISMRAEEC